MFRKLYQVYTKLQFYRKALNGKGHGTHSPFVYTFITEVLNDNRYFYAYEEIGYLKKRLLNDNTKVDYNGKEITISELVKQSLPDKYNQLLFRIVAFYKPQNIVEIGTSLGISTAYVASPNINIKVYSVEEDLRLATIAKQNLEELSLTNVLINTSVTDIFKEVETNSTNYGLIFINQTREDAFQVFVKLISMLDKDTIVVLAGINKGLGTTKSWGLMKSHESTTISIELYQLGLVFFRKEQLKKQHFAVRF